MSTKEDLQKLIQSIRDKKYRDGEAKGMMSAIQAEQTKALQPVLEAMAKSIGEVAKNAIEGAIKNIKVEIPPIDIPPIDVRYPDIPAPQVTVSPPKVNVTMPEVRIPESKFPEFPKFPDLMKVMVDGVDNKRPLPVMMMDTQGRPFQFPIGASGGKGDYFTIKGFSTSAFAELQNPDGRLKVELPTGSSGLTDTELRSSSVPVAQVSGITWSTNVVDAFGSTAVGSVFNADNRIRVSVETGGSGLTDAELRASSVPVEQVSGSNWSTYVTGIFNSTSADVINPDNRIKVELPSGASGLTDTELRASSIPVAQASGANWSTSVTNTVSVDISGQSVGDLNVTGSVQVTGITNTVGASLINSSGEQYSGSNALPVYIAKIATATTSVNIVDSSGIAYSGSNPVPVGGTITAVTGITNSVAAANVDSSGVQYSGSNPFPMRVVTDASSTLNVRIVDSSGVGYAGANPVPVTVTGALSTSAAVYTRQTNPTAVAADYVPLAADDLGRQLVRNIQVRDLIKTAYVSVINGTEATLLAATAGSFNDLVMVVGSNNSDAAVSLDIRAVTAGNIINTLRIPANGTAGWTPPVPWPQDATGNNWTVDGPDETGRTITVSALFSTEV